MRGKVPAAGRGAAALPVPLLRSALERELARVSLRQAAREIGLSPNAVRNFVRGARPRAATRFKIERWLASRGHGARGPSLSSFVRLMERVTPDLPPREMRALGREMSELLLEAYHRQHLPPPRWVRELARHYAAESD